MEKLILDQNTQISNNRILLNYKEVQVTDGAFYKLTSGFATSKTLLQSENYLSKHNAVFNFCLKGNQSFTLTGNYLPTEANPESCNVLLLPDETFQSRIETEGEFATATLFLPLEKYYKILGDAIQILPKNFIIASENRNLCYFKNHDWHPRIKQIASQILHEKYSPVAEKIFLESKMLEMIAIMIDMYKYDSESIRFIPKKDEEKIRFAKLIIEKDISNPPSLSKLAQLIGSNEFTLKKGFKAVYGLPVFRFLHRLRMNQANELLVSTNLSIQEVASKVGYGNLSAFTRAFKKEHLILPSELRKNPSRHI